MAFCAACGQELGPGARFCAACGTAGDAYSDLGEVLALAGDPVGAAGAYEDALDCCERKQNVVAAERVRARLAELAATA
ncbi:MAG TPA: zinc ribbon domain-containing protein [Solirubrobacteraceae bacterium]|nr:zinc ribbon domain-containing protein [Solirubrobacteraceae bacterium]